MVKVQEPILYPYGFLLFHLHTFPRSVKELAELTFRSEEAVRNSLLVAEANGQVKRTRVKQPNGHWADHWRRA